MRKLLIITLTALLASCDNEIDPVAESSGNILILNEGNFGSGNATIGLYSTDDTTYTETTFQSANGFFIGDVLQSISVEGEMAYAVLNGSNKVEAFSLTDFSTVETLTDTVIDKPRYLAITGNTAYLTIWGTYGENFSLVDSKVGIINLNDFTLEKSIDTAPGVEQIIAADGKLYVTRNFFGAYSNLTIIDAVSQTIITDIELPAGPDEVFIDEANRVWVACTSGKIVEIDKANNTIAQTIDVADEIFADVALYNNELYFIEGESVKKINLDSQAVTTVLTGLSFDLLYAFDVNPFNGDIYIGDGIAFGSEGKVLHYNASGDLVASFTSGILPTAFIFR